MLGQQTADGPMVDMRSVVKSFGSLRVLNDVSMRVDRGQVVVIIGPSGSGKSTLLRCINRLETVDSGAIDVDGRSLQALFADVPQIAVKMLPIVAGRVIDNSDHHAN